MTREDLEKYLRKRTGYKALVVRFLFQSPQESQCRLCGNTKDYYRAAVTNNNHAEVWTLCSDIPACESREEAMRRASAAKAKTLEIAQARETAEVLAQIAPP